MSPSLPRVAEGVAATKRRPLGGGQADAAGRGRGGGGGGRGANLKGLLIFDGAGHAFEMITRAAMAQPIGATQALTESQLRFAGSGGFWGSCKVDGQTKAITFKAEGAVSPNMMGREFTRSFEVAGDRLTVTYTGPNTLRRRAPDGPLRACPPWITCSARPIAKCWASGSTSSRSA